MEEKKNTHGGIMTEIEVKQKNHRFPEMKC